MFFISLAYYSRPKRLENNAYAKCLGQIRCIMENVEVAYCEYSLSLTERKNILFHLSQ